MAARYWRSVSPFFGFSSGEPKSNDESSTPHPPTPTSAPTPAPPSVSTTTTTPATSSINYATSALVFTGIQAVRQDFEKAMERERSRRAASEEAVRQRAEDLAAQQQQALRALQSNLESLVEARAATRDEALEARLARVDAEVHKGRLGAQPSEEEKKAAAARLVDIGARLEALEASVETLTTQFAKRHAELGDALKRRDMDADDRWESIHDQMREADVRHHDNVVLLGRNYAGLEVMVAEYCRRYSDDIKSLREGYTSLERMVAENKRRHDDDIELLRKDHASLERRVSGNDGRHKESIEALRRDCANLGDALGEYDRRQNDSIVLLREDCASLEAAVAEHDRRHNGTIEQLERDCGSIERRYVDTEERLSSLERQLDQHVVRLLQLQEQQQRQRPEQQQHVRPPSPERRWQRTRSPSPTTAPPTTFSASPPLSQTAQDSPAAETNARSDDPPQTRPVRIRRPRNRAAALAKELRSLGAGGESRDDRPRKGSGVATIPELLFSFDKRYRHKKPSPEHRLVREFLQSVHDVLPEHDRTRVESRFLSLQRGVFYRRRGEETLWCSASAKWHDVRLCMWSFKEVRDVMMPNSAS